MLDCWLEMEEDPEEDEEAAEFTYLEWIDRKLEAITLEENQKEILWRL